jgi:3-oxoadipate enol-lactonase
MAKTKTGGIELYYEIHGDGPPLVLINGLGLDIGSWAPQIGPLSSRFRVLAFDSRGAGRSDAPEGPYSAEQMAADTVALFDHLQLERVHILGFSLGGLIAQELALSHPGRVKSLVLASTAARLPPRAGHVIHVWRRMAQARVEPELFLREQLAWVFGERLFDEESRVSDVVRVMLSNPFPPSPQGFAGQAAACLGHDTRLRLGRIDVPTLVLVGREDVLLTVAASEQLAAGIPGAGLAVLDGGSHAFAAEIPDRFNEAVLQFLESVEGKAHEARRG